MARGSPGRSRWASLALFLLFGGALVAQSPTPQDNEPTGGGSPPSVNLPIPYVAGERIPASVRTMAAELPPRPSAQLQQRVDQMAAATAVQRDATLRDYTYWWVSRVAGNMPEVDRRRLTANYLKFFRAAVPLTQDSASVDQAAADSRHRQLAVLMADLLLSEREILRRYPDSQRLRYGRRLRYDLPLPPRPEIDNGILGFTSGSYMRGSAATLPKPLPNDSSRILERTGAQGTFRVAIRRLPTADIYRGPTLFCADTSERRYAVVTGRSAVDWVGYAFAGARSLVPGTWEDIGLPGLYHASILAGRWYLEKTVERVTTVKCGGAGTKPLSTSRNQTTYTWRFHDWTVANGCGGQYVNPDDGDTLTLFKVFHPSTPGLDPAEDVARQILGSTRDGNGKACRARFGAYPRGPYGITWVCHQACNAFAHFKWDVDPVFYPVSFPLYGTRGNLGVADVDAPCACEDTHANPCAVSGEGGACWLNTAFGLGDGWGDNLNSGFHFRNGWIDTQCKFKQEPAAAHVPGWDFAPVVVGG